MSKLNWTVAGLAFVAVACGAAPWIALIGAANVVCAVAHAWLDVTEEMEDEVENEAA